MQASYGQTSPLGRLVRRGPGESAVETPGGAPGRRHRRRRADLRRARRARRPGAAQVTRGQKRCRSDRASRQRPSYEIQNAAWAARIASTSRSSGRSCRRAIGLDLLRMHEARGERPASARCACEVRRLAVDDDERLEADHDRLVEEQLEPEKRVLAVEVAAVTAEAAMTENCLAPRHRRARDEVRHQVDGEPGRGGGTEPVEALAHAPAPPHLGRRPTARVEVVARTRQWRPPAAHRASRPSSRGRSAATRRRHPGTREARLGPRRFRGCAPPPGLRWPGERGGGVGPGTPRPMQRHRPSSRRPPPRPRSPGTSARRSTRAPAARRRPCRTAARRSRLAGSSRSWTVGPGTPATGTTRCRRLRRHLGQPCPRTG